MIKKVIKITDMKSSESDYKFWQSQSYQARMDALESIRTEYIKWKYKGEQRLQRVYKIIEPGKS